ncbi:hypothetical protein J4732_18840 [Serratia marcescens]|uniref:Uncharacterized protein n=1 Tax=Serratia marcescens TaxID=615 RepID=A0A939NKJ6_SERMA|nr:hypothetical protein [Serratia marcescens]
MRHDERIRLTAPANVALIGKPTRVTINMRVERAVSGSVVVRLGEEVLYRKTHRCPAGTADPAAQHRFAGRRRA